ncbi:MAG TPA: hypothetical protein VNA69_03835 [Thermoanaerobaculia bacterium]|nr:hypothetical protein [Thermoanaerobaculia bacterium]
MRALAKGVADANLRRKHSLGNAILTLYALLPPLSMDDAGSYLRPFYEEMKAIYARTRKRSRAAAKGSEGEERG